jgi:hypothetical protein
MAQKNPARLSIALMQYPGLPLIAAKLRVVGEWATRRRRAEKADTASLQRVPSARTIARLMTARRDHLSKADTVTIATIEQGLPTPVTARSLITDFQAIIRTKAISELPAWLGKAGTSLVASFARGVINDEKA